MNFRDKLSVFWNNLQHKLIPTIEQQMGPLSKKHKIIIAVLEIIQIERFLFQSRFHIGRPKKDRIQLARAFIAKVILKKAYNNDLIELLKVDSHLRVICGWYSVNEIPSESKFSRAFCEFAESELPDRVHQAVIKEAYEDKIVFHVVKDSTALVAREKFVPESKASKLEIDRAAARRRYRGEPNRRQNQLLENNLDKMIADLPKLCDKGLKRNASGYTITWRGYKLHVAIDDHCIPLAALVTSASLNDCEAAIPLAAKCSKVVTNLYDLMDAAYDHPEIKEHSRLLGHVAIIDKCPRSKAEKLEKKAEQDRSRLMSFQTAEQERYRRRMPAERFNALYKNFYGGDTLKQRGHKKITCEIMFGVLALTGSLLLRLSQ